jgi:4-amino-4-deoxy-L-arabinose transferase-like glycosyltransferase
MQDKQGFTGFLLTLPNVKRLLFSSVYAQYFALACLLCLGYVSFYHHLGHKHMHLWDESSYALNAQEMVENGNMIEVFRDKQPEIYNSKPPFAIWVISVGIQLFGFTEKGVRVGVATFGLLACVLLFLVCFVITKNPWQALAAPLVLLSSTGFVSEHAARTADTDAILAFWVLAYIISFFAFTQGWLKKYSLLITFCCLSAACFTKGIAGLVGLPALLLWAFYSRTFFQVIKSKQFYIGLTVFMIWIGGYYALRSYLTPGYWQAVTHFEIGGRLERQEFLNPEVRPFYYYYQLFFTEGRLQVWCWLLLPAALCIVFIPSQTVLKKLAVCMLLGLLGISFSLAVSSTKLFWYDAPMHPLVAGVIGSAFMLVLQYWPKWKWALSGVGLILFAIPFFTIAQRNHAPQNEMHVREAIEHIRNEMKYEDTLRVVEVDINFAIQFYLKQDSLNGHIGRIYLPNDSLFKPNMSFLTCKHGRLVDMQNLYILDTLYQYYECGFYRIKSVRSKQ